MTQGMYSGNKHQCILFSFFIFHIVVSVYHRNDLNSFLLIANTCHATSHRLVLMSATIDSTQYVEYFKDIGKVELITIPSSSCSNFQRKVQYLEQVCIDSCSKLK